jgi:hypothetical protein
MLPQAKPSPELFHQITPTKLATNLLAAKRQLHSLNKISTTNHQQGSKPMCILSKYI